MASMSKDYASAVSSSLVNVHGVAGGVSSHKNSMDGSSIKESFKAGDSNAGIVD